MAPVTTVCLLLVILAAAGSTFRVSTDDWDPPSNEDYPNTDGAPNAESPSASGYSADSTNDKAVASNGDTKGNNNNVIVVGSSGPSRDGASISGYNKENRNTDSSSSSIKLSR